jgi:hypothetical protein
MPCSSKQLANQARQLVHSRPPPAPCGFSPGAPAVPGGGWRHGAPPTSPFRRRGRRGNAVFRAGLQAPEVHQARFQWPQAAPPYLCSPQKKCKPPAVLRSLPPACPAALRGGCTAPQIP